MEANAGILSNDKSAVVETDAALTDLTPEEIAAQLGVKLYRGRQLFRWIHRKRVFDPAEMTDLPTDLRERLAATSRIGRLSVVRIDQSAETDTRKALFALPGADTVESVLMRDEERVTLCLSSQVGCAVKCSFCATGLSGFTRNLTAGQIVEQALCLLHEENLGGRSPNVVYMGMGEPFRNYDEVLRSARLLMHPDGLGIGARRITISTAGEAGQIERFAGEDLQVRLSVSLHAANDRLRDELVPLNRRYDLARLKQAIVQYQSRTHRQVTIEWTLIRGVNDSREHARELIAWSTGLKIFVNLIPYNPVEGLDYAPSSPAVCRAFRDELLSGGLKTTLRFERGQDIRAACGQLRRTHLDRSGS